MPYIRLSIVHPRRGEEGRAEELLRKIARAVRESEGCLESYVLRPHDDSGELARISIFENEDSAERAANGQTMLALRSELHLASEPGHVERAFFTV
jgi:quinol monooxygenase YgiN